MSAASRKTKEDTEEAAQCPCGNQASCPRSRHIAPCAQASPDACHGREESQEKDEWGHGAFTKALLEGLDGQADCNKDGAVYLTELDAYVTDRVKVLTKGQQHPTTHKPSTVRSFPLAASK